MSNTDTGPGAQPPRAVIFGCAGTSLTAEERDFFAEADPVGFILFTRNCKDPDQVRALVTALRECIGRADAPILIDQEGGRIVRLSPPHWRRLPAPALIGAAARRDSESGREAAWAAGRLIAADLFPLGITVDCAPVLDVPGPDSHGVIGDRAFADSPDLVADLGRAFADGLLAGGVLPVIKHIPGHGRAKVDSHAALPVVDALHDDLESIDFAPFRALKDLPWAMTAHVVYPALDDAAPATTSARVVAEVIRGAIGFDGVLVSDDLSMGALSGTVGERTAAALAAGCDIALHCNGDLGEMAAVAAAARPLDGAAASRLTRAEQRRRPPGKADLAALEARLRPLFGKAAAA